MEIWLCAETMWANFEEKWKNLWFYREQQLVKRRENRFETAKKFKKREISDILAKY